MLSSTICIARILRPVDYYWPSSESSTYEKRAHAFTSIQIKTRDSVKKSWQNSHHAPCTLSLSLCLGFNKLNTPLTLSPTFTCMDCHCHSLFPHAHANILLIILSFIFLNVPKWINYMEKVNSWWCVLFKPPSLPDSEYS